MLDLTGAAVPWPPAFTAMFAEALATAAAAGPADVPWPGDPGLRALLADQFRVPVEQVAVTAGVRFTVRGLTAGRVTVVERPTFAGIPRMLIMLGHLLRFATWEGLLAGEPSGSGQPQTWWVTSPARNPDGRTLTSVEAATLAERAAARGARVVQNLSYHWCDPAAALIPGAVLAGGLHKLAGPGARLGWAIGDGVPELLKPELRAAAPAGMWQRAWSALLAADLLEPLRGEVTRAVAARDAFLRTWGAGPAPVPPAPHLLLGVGRSDEVGLDLLRQAGIRGGAGATFHAAEPSVRLSFSAASPREAADAGSRLRRVTFSGDKRTV